MNGAACRCPGKCNSMICTACPVAEKFFADRDGVELVYAILGGCNMKAFNIIWDVDDERDLQLLPTEIDIPDGMEDDDEISDYISEVTGFCHKGYSLDTD